MTSIRDILIVVYIEILKRVQVVALSLCTFSMKIPTRKLGTNGPEVSVIGFGVAGMLPYIYYPSLSMKIDKLRCL